MKFLSELIKYFCYITTGIVLVSGITVAGSDGIPGITLLQTLLAGAVTAVVTTVLLTGEPKSKADMYFRLGLHFALLCVIMIGIGFWFCWIPRDLLGALFMVVSVAVVYVFTAISYMMTSRREVGEMNRALREKYHDDQQE